MKNDKNLPNTSIAMVASDEIGADDQAERQSPKNLLKPLFILIPTIAGLVLLKLLMEYFK